MSSRRLVVVLPGIRDWSPRTWFVGGSLAVHFAIAIVVIVAPSLRGRTVPPMDVPVVSLAGSLRTPSPPSLPRVAPASTSPPVPTPAPPREPVKQPGPKIPKAPAPDKPRKEPKQETEPGPPVPAPTPAPPEPTPSQGAAGTGVPAAGGITALESGDPEFAWYRASVIAALRSRWTRPVIEDAMGTITATVAFEIRRDGSVQDVRVESPSGVSVMDRSVLRAVIEATPLPPLPPSWREPTLSARFEFRWRPGDPD